MTSVVYIWFLCLALGFTKTLSYLDPEFDSEEIEKLRAMKRASYFNYQLRSFNICVQWKGRCVPWSSESIYTCCDSLACRCNLWGQNCKCLSRLWG